jgi:hypothetical protein
MMIKQFPNADVVKGKMVVDPDQGFKRATEGRANRPSQKKEMDST